MSLERIKKAIHGVLPEATVIVQDPQGDGQHFEAVVVSAEFEGLPLVRQHQKVMNALKEDFAGAVHALALRTFTPERWEEAQKDFGVGGG